MRLTETELKEIVRLQGARRGAGQACLSEELLRRAASKDLDHHERERVASHLTVCSDCVRDYRVARSVRDWAEQAAMGVGAQTLEPASGRQLVRTGFFATGRFKAWPGVTSRRLVLYAFAASLIAVISIGAWIVLRHGSDARNVARLNAQLADRDRAIQELQQSLEDTRKSSAPSGARSDSGKTGSSEARADTREARIAALEGVVAELTRPQINIPIVDVEPGHARGGSGDSITRIDVPKSANLFTLILHRSGKQTSAGYTLEISGAGGKLIFRGRGMNNTTDSGVTVALSRRLMPAGRYSIKLYPLEGNRTEPVEQYVVEVRYR